jgi:phage/plasmid-like protein (TIGR03299 family)
MRFVVPALNVRVRASSLNCCARTRDIERGYQYPSAVQSTVAKRPDEMGAIRAEVAALIRLGCLPPRGNSLGVVGDLAVTPLALKHQSLLGDVRCLASQLGRVHRSLRRLPSVEAGQGSHDHSNGRDHNRPGPITQSEERNHHLTSIARVSDRTSHRPRRSARRQQNPAASGAAPAGPAIVASPDGDAAGAATGSAPGGATPPKEGEMPAGLTDTDSMFSVRVTPWHGLGAVLDQPPASVSEAIEASGLGWGVAKEPIALDRGEDWQLDARRYRPIEGNYATVRQDTGDVLGIVGERYRIVQNHEAFAFIDQLLGSDIHFETAGSLHGGRRVWVLATLPEHVEVGGDAVRPYVLLMNSHDGSTAVIAATTPIRVVCQNTLNWGLQNARQKFSIRHTEAVTQRVHEARRVLELSINYYEQFKRFGDELASEPCTERQLRTVLDQLYPNGAGDTASSRTRRSRQQTKDRIAELFLEGTTQGNAPGSKWAAVNAIVEYGDWLRPLRSSGQRFARALDDGPEKTRALALVTAA